MPSEKIRPTCDRAEVVGQLQKQVDCSPSNEIAVRQACAECGASFAPRGPGSPQRFCSRSCRYTSNNRKRKAADNSLGDPHNSLGKRVNHSAPTGVAADADWRDWPPTKGTAS